MSAAAAGVMTAAGRRGLLVWREELVGRVAELSPVLAAELTEVLLALDGIEKLPESYAEVSNPFDAVWMFLERCGAWSEKRAICRSIMEGGFPGDPVRGTGYLLGVIEFAVEKGRLRRVHDLIGLPDWDPSMQGLHNAVSVRAR